LDGVVIRERTQEVIGVERIATAHRDTAFNEPFELFQRPDEGSQLMASLLGLLYERPANSTRRPR
jgi:hypothetical protein